MVLLFALAEPAMPGARADEMVIEDFSDIVTPLDRDWDNFSGNRVPIHPEWVALGMSASSGHSAMSLRWDFHAAQDPQAMAGVAYSLFGMLSTEDTFDGRTTSIETFPEQSLNLDELDGVIDEPDGPRRATALAVDVLRGGTNACVLRVELRDVAGHARFTRFTVKPSPQVRSFRWLFRDPTQYQVAQQGDIDLHTVKILALVIEKNPTADGAANPELGSVDVCRLALVTDRDEPKPKSDDDWMNLAERRAGQYFFDWSSRKAASAGLPQDRSAFADLLSTAACGYGLAACVIAAERDWLPRHDAAAQALAILCALDNPSAFGSAPVGRIGYHGWYYRFLGIDARRKLNFDYKDTPIDESLNTVEIDPVDTAVLVMGALAAQSYFQLAEPEEFEIRRRAQFIVDRVDWPFMIDPASRQFHHGWKPQEKREGPAYEISDGESNGSFAGTPGHPELYDSYSDATALLTLLAAGGTEHPAPDGVWCAWKRAQDDDHLVRSVSGSLASFQTLHAFINTRDFSLPPCAGQAEVNWYENSRQAMLRAMGLAKKSRYSTYGPDAWGVSGTEGPFEQYHDYGFSELAQADKAQAIEDGTVTYSAMVSAASFGDDLKARAISALKSAWTRGHWDPRFGPATAFSQEIGEAGIATEARKFETVERRHGPWVQHTLFAAQQGLMLVHLENARSGLIWKLLAGNPNIQRALDRLSAPPSIALEAEDGEGGGRVVSRQQARGQKTIQLLPKETRTLSFEISSPASYMLSVRYSNDSYGDPEIVDVNLDGHSVGTFTAYDTSRFVGTGSYGSAWNVFASTAPIGPVDLAPGRHSITLTVLSGDAHGVEIDTVSLKRTPKQP